MVEELYAIKKVPGKRGKYAEEKIPLYTVVTTSTKECRAHVTIRTWDEAIKYLENFNCDRDDDSIWRKITKYHIDNERHRAELEYAENHKGWGYDYMVNIYIDRAYYFD